MPGRRAKDDRDLDRYPYSSRLSTIQSTKPFMSQPLLGLVDQASNFSQHDGDVVKFLTCAERSPSREEAGIQKMPPSIHHDLPPRTGIQNKNPDPLLPRSSSPQSMPRHFSGVTHPVQDGSRRNIDVPSLVVTPLNAQEAVSTTRVYSVTSTTSLSHRAQLVSGHPTAAEGGERPGTANSVQASNSSATSKTALLNGKRSFSQLRLNIKTKQNSDLTGSSSKPGSMSTNISSTSTCAVTQSLSSKSLPPTPAVKAAATLLASPVPVPSTTDKTPPSNSTTSTSTATGMPSSTNIHKPLPPPGGTLANLVKDQPPKLSLGSFNHRLSFNLKTPTVTEGGLARLSPTVITRPPPLPLLNLPTLTPRSDSLTEASTAFNFNRGRMTRSGKVGEGGSLRSREDQERSIRRSQLKSMPALPRKGSGWGVSGHEEVDDYEDELVDDDDDDYDGDSSRNDMSSRSGLLAPDMGADSMRSSLASSRSSLTSVDQRDNLLPPSLSGRGRPYREEEEETGTYSSGDSSYHSARSIAYPSPRPELAASSSVPRIKYPTPRGYGQGRGRAAASPVAASAPAPQASGMQNRSILSHAGPSHLASTDSQSGLPEVDGARINVPSSSSSPPSLTVIDVKGKGKARDHSASHVRSASGSVVTGGTTPTAANLTNQAVIGAFDRYSYHADDSSKTPIATTVRNGFPFRESEFKGMNGHAQNQKRLGKLNSRGSLAAIPNEAEPSPTATVRQQYESHVSGTVGGENASKREGGGGEHISEQSASTEGSQPSPPALPLHLHTHNSPLLSSPFDPFSQNRSTLLSRHSTYHPSTRNPPTSSPASSFGLQTPKAGFSGMKHSVDHLAPMATKRGSNLLSVGTGGGDGTGFKRPKMYQRASQSMIDIHTLETKEQRRKLEEEARAAEEREMMKLRQKKKKEGRRKTMKDEKAKNKEGEKLRDEDEKIKGDDDKSAEAREREDQLGPPVKPSLASKNANTIASPSTEGPSGLTKRLSHLRRRRSMPMFDVSSEPPPYPSFTLLHTSPTSRYRVMPREDEGQERLPPYSNHISLRAIMPRKLEFSSPGVQAKDRKWRRTMCVLEGTALKVYKAPRGHAGVGVFGEWWEKQVGAGDVSLQPSHSEGVSNIQIETREARRAAEERRDLERQIQRIIKMEGGDDVVGGEFGTVEDEVVVVEPPRTESNPAPKRTLKTSRSSSRLKQFLKPGKHNRSKSDVNQSERTTQSPSPRPSLNIPRNSGASTPVSGGSLSPFPGSGSMRAPTPMSSSSQSVTESNSASGHTTTPTSTTAHSMFLRRQPSAGLANKSLFTNREKPFLPDPDPADLIRVYSLQNAESGIGNDYLKRRNVIRLRLEGEQFLLQARDVTGVVEWIEVRNWCQWWSGS